MDVDADDMLNALASTGLNLSEDNERTALTWPDILAKRESEPSLR